MATRKAKEIITKIAEPVVVKGSHLTVTIYPDGKRKLEWDDEALARDVSEAIASLNTKPNKKSKAKTKT